MYKVFINKRTVYLAENIDHNYICANDHPLECTNMAQVENAFSHFISDPSKTTLYLYNQKSPEKLFQLFVSLFSFIKAAGGLVKDPQNRLLFIYRLGFWDLPKGKIETGEDAPAAALREVTEETGLNNLKIIKPLPSTYHIFERKGKQCLKQTYWFEMSSSREGPLLPQVEEDILEVRWFSRQKVTLPLSITYPAIKELIEGYLTQQF
jgi:8-oxo-dGTP pyrophosphatase MutT (NUDIX family)